MIKKSRAQASFEYIVIYGWATLIILASIGILYSFDLLNFNSFLGDKCSFYGQTDCIESQAIALDSGIGNITVVLLNNFGTDLVIYNYSISDEYFTCDPKSDVHEAWLTNERYTLQFKPCGDSDEDFVQNSRTRSQVTVYYYRNTTLCNDGSNNIADICKLQLEGLVEETIVEPYN